MALPPSGDPIGVEDIDRLGSILSIWAHPDDETFLAGAIMAAAREQGASVTCISATAGERGTDDPVAWPPERLGQVRRWEAAAAMAIIGVADHRFLDLPDGELATLNPTAIVNFIAAIIKQERPDTILTFGPDGTTYHPDHQTISAWVTQAWEIAGRPSRLLYQAASEPHLQRWGPEFERWGIYMTDERPVGVPVEKLAVRLVADGPLLDRKHAALCAMHTQIAPSLAALGEELFRELNAEEAFVEVLG
jgi:LmbE family N-acetylglucosaminyl deacetylase